jgi:hypothetical protein
MAVKATELSPLLWYCFIAGSPAGLFHALLAQSVAHFHGKEKVVGSIPTEGSIYE